MWQRTMYLIRYSAAILTLVFAPGLFLSQPALADFGGCSEEEQKGCITKPKSYAGKACTSGQGVDCITCDWDPGSVCTWGEAKENLDDYYPEDPN